MAVHHQKHHATYVANLNAAEDKLKQAVEKGIRFYTQLSCLREGAMKESYLSRSFYDKIGTRTLPWMYEVKDWTGISK